MGLKSDLSSFLLRMALAASFLSAVADRFGLWGAYGHAHVAWGNFARFVDYTHVLTSTFPMPLSVFFAWTATAAEIILATLVRAEEIDEFAQHGCFQAKSRKVETAAVC
jgi:ABC-type uncharacterized transport system YnjBCD permease subunit